jgi:nicotinamide riboside kinase
MEKAMANSKRKIIIVTGPESTGKTSIALHLSEVFNGSYIPEYARNYIAGLNRPYNYLDISHIGNWQKEHFEKEFSEENNAPCFIDTYLIITKIWFQWHTNTIPDWIDNAIEQSKNALYLLCAPDIEWIADEVRENGGENRLKLFEIYKEELEKFNLNYKIVDNIDEARQLNAINFVKEYLL